MSDTPFGGVGRETLIAAIACEVLCSPRSTDAEQDYFGVHGRDEDRDDAAQPRPPHSINGHLAQSDRSSERSTPLARSPGQPGCARPERLGKSPAIASRAT